MCAFGDSSIGVCVLMGNLKSYPKIMQTIDTVQTDPLNGFILNGVYIPEDVLMLILSFVQPQKILNMSLVCKNWNKIIKSHSLWLLMYKHKYNKSYKIGSVVHPWYLYHTLLIKGLFNTNLIKNGNGQDKFKYWSINLNCGDKFKIENPPIGCDPLPADVDEFGGFGSCFATSYSTCSKQQCVDLSSLINAHIMDNYHPEVYVSEWVNGRYDCGSIYTLKCSLINMDKAKNVEFYATHRVEQFQNQGWTKVEIHIKDYPVGVRSIVFEHSGKDTQFWSGHYGSKMAGGLLKLIFK